MNRNGIIYSQIATVLGGDDDGEGNMYEWYKGR